MTRITPAVPTTVPTTVPTVVSTVVSTVVPATTLSTPAKLTHQKTYKTKNKTKKPYKTALMPHKLPIRVKFKGADWGPYSFLSPQPVPQTPLSRSTSQTASQTTSQTTEVLGLNHFNITASPALVEQLKSFYVEVIGLTVGPRAQLDHGGFWLYAGESAILHLSARQQSCCQQSTYDIATSTETPRREGCFNHISLSCTGLASTVKRLIALKIPYRIAEVPDFGQTQIFIHDPAGIGVELTFLNERPNEKR